MNNTELLRQANVIRTLITETDLARSAASIDPSTLMEKQAHWARYLCILCAGFVENAIKDLYSGYANRTVSEPVARFVAARLRGTRNPKQETILTIAAQFKPIWKDELDAYLRDQGRGDAIDTIMTNRHLIAHGQYRNSSITIIRISEYFEKAFDVVEFIEAQCSA